MKRALTTGLVLVLIGAVLLGIRIVTRSGMLKSITSHHTGACRVVEGVAGAEDATIDATVMRAYLSADDRRAAGAGMPKRGEIYGLDLRDPEAAPVPLTGGVPVDFHPHGISLWHGPDGARRLFVVHHASPGHAAPQHAVLIYDVAADGTLALADTITYPELRSPNDVVAVGERQFYASNDRGHPEPGLMATLEGYLQLPLASVSYFDGVRGSLALTGLVFANGVNATDDGRIVYVAELLGQRVNVYDRDPATGALTLRDTIGLGSAPDNVEVAEDGTLWIAAHPKIFDLLAHGADPTKRAPSQALHVDPKARTVQEVFLDDGAELSAASTATVGGDRMILSPIYDARVLVCDRPPT